ncbi:hypothetical protein K470DRAFT_269887 [Piedraia hortae CBS 480.64]|uniref:Uncharacterized protein n=1 Tax=Piedraia hortae CBS 480.64 TaxID=1314780 RepID=A0A6A7C1V6_9PEZI|nr:hypothetical protein K470DRAFT_269887 [Piedraia hortae CBS 480.64]
MSQVSNPCYTIAEVANAAHRFDPKTLSQGYELYRAGDLSVEGVYAPPEEALIVLEHSEFSGHYAMSKAAYSREKGLNRTCNPEGAIIRHDLAEILSSVQAPPAAQTGLNIPMTDTDVQYIQQRLKQTKYGPFTATQRFLDQLEKSKQHHGIHYRIDRGTDGRIS